MDFLYKSTFKNRMSHIYLVYVTLFAIAIFILFMVFKFGVSDLNEYIYIAVSLYGFLLMFPTLFIHFSYLITNYKDQLKISFDSEIIEYQHKGRKILFHFNEIQLIDEYKTPALLRRSPGWLPWETYHYIKITLDNGKEIFITCFMANELELPIDKSRIKLHKIFYPYLRS